MADGMLEEQARVVTIDGEYAWVETQRESSCGGCSAKSGCGTALISDYFGGRRNTLRVLNPVGAQPDERVIIGLDEAALTRSSFAVYMVPLLALIGAAIVGQWLAAEVFFIAAEPVAILTGLLGLSIGLLWVRRYATRVGSDRRHQAVILRRDTSTTIGVIHERFVV